MLASFHVHYLTRKTEEPFTSDHYAALNAVKAIKGEPLIGEYSWVPVAPPPNLRLTEQNKDSMLQWAADRIAKSMVAQKFGPVVLVPAPSRSQIIGTNIVSRVDTIANLIAAKPGAQASVSKAVLWKQQLPPQHGAGGQRSWQIRHANMNLATPIPAGKIILVDDVITSGSTLKAMAKLLADSGNGPTSAVCAAHAHQGYTATVFGDFSIDLDALT